MQGENHEHFFEFGFGERYHHHVVPYEDIDDVPAGPGLYSWHFRLPRNNPDKAAPFLTSLFQAAQLEISANANMRQEWKGHISTSVNPFGEELSPALAQAFFAIAYPLYIGISVNLRQRLRTHKHQLNQYMNAAYKPPEQSPQDDTEEESRCFGHRLGTVFSEAQFFQTELLFVKCVTFDDGPSNVKDLRDAEWTCNTLFHPVFGKR